MVAHAEAVTQSESASAEPPYVLPLSRTDTPTVLEPRGGDDADMNGDPPSDSEYAGFPGMSADIDDEATADCFPVPESDSESDSDDEAMPQLDIAPQATAETPQAAWEDASPGGAVRPRDDVDSTSHPSELQSTRLRKRDWQRSTRSTECKCQVSGMRRPSLPLTIHLDRPSAACGCSTVTYSRSPQTTLCATAFRKT